MIYKGPEIGRIEAHDERTKENYASKALSEINQSFKVLGSEMKLVASQFDKNDSSVQALTARNNVLNKEIEAQKEKIEVLRSALANASESFGETDRRTQSWQIQLNNAEAALSDMERELEENNDKLKAADSSLDAAGDAASGMGKDMDSASGDAEDLADATEDAGNSADKASDKFSGFGTILKSVGAAVGTVVAAAAAAAIALGKEVVDSFAELEQNLGGAEAVFGEYAESIERTAENAYKTMRIMRKVSKKHSLILHISWHRDMIFRTKEDFLHAGNYEILWNRCKDLSHW